MKTLLFTLTVTFALSPIAQADIIKCNFTEPFFQLQYSTTTRQIRIWGPEINKRQNNVSFQIKGPAQFDLYSSRNRVLMTLHLNFQGSDGMSDTIYPYAARLTAPHLVPGTQHGGCQSNFLRAQMPE